MSDSERLIAATEGGSGAFIKELFRKALLLAAERDDNATINDDNLEQALSSIKNGSPMMAKLLAYKTSSQLTLELAV